MSEAGEGPEERCDDVTTEESDAQRTLRLERRAVWWMLVAILISVSAVVWWPESEGAGLRIDQDRGSLRVDVNRATWVELIQLPGIGPKLAERILADRDRNGPFGDLSDLSRVRGIGPKLLEEIGPYLTWPTPAEGGKELPAEGEMGGLKRDAD